MLDSALIKLASPAVEILPLITQRWSPRAFAAKPVSRQLLHKLFEAARWSPSSSNEQPWHFLVGMDKNESWHKIFDALDEGNRAWCKFAPVLGVVVAHRNFTRHQKPNLHYMYDCGQAMAYLSIEATEQKVYVHQMAGFFPEKVSAAFNIPGQFEPVTAFAIGYLGDPGILNEKDALSEVTPRSRRHLDATVFEDSWNLGFVFEP